MIWIRDKWHDLIERASVLRLQDASAHLPRPQWSAKRVLLMAVLLALSGGLLWNCEGNAWLFCSGIVVSGQLAGAAAGLPFGRAVQGALCGSVLGLLFFAYAAGT